MTVGEFREVLQAVSGRDVNIDPKRLYTLIRLKTLKLAKDTIPLLMVVTADSHSDVYRRIDNDTFIRKPNIVYAESEDLDIEDELAEALALLCLAEIEKVKAPSYMGMYHGLIDDNNSRLIEVALTEASNDSAYINRTWV